MEKDSIKLAQQMIAACTYYPCHETVVKLWRQILRVEGSKRSPKKHFDLKSVLDRESRSPFAQKIYCKGGYKYASDGYILARVKAEYEEEGAYFNAFTGEADIYGKPEDYEAVIKSIENKPGRPVKLNFEKVEELSDREKADRRLKTKKWMYLLKIQDRYFALRKLRILASFVRDYNAEISLPDCNDGLLAADHEGNILYFMGNIYDGMDDETFVLDNELSCPELLPLPQER